MIIYHRLFFLAGLSRPAVLPILLVELIQCAIKNNKVTLPLGGSGEVARICGTVVPLGFNFDLPRIVLASDSRGQSAFF